MELRMLLCKGEAMQRVSFAHAVEPITTGSLLLKGLGGALRSLMKVVLLRVSISPSIRCMNSRSFSVTGFCFEEDAANAFGFSDRRKS